MTYKGRQGWGGWNGGNDGGGCWVDTGACTKIYYSWQCSYRSVGSQEFRLVPAIRGGTLTVLGGASII